MRRLLAAGMFIALIGGPAIPAGASTGGSIHGIGPGTGFVDFNSPPNCDSESVTAPMAMVASNGAHVVTDVNVFTLDVSFCGFSAPTGTFTGPGISCTALTWVGSPPTTLLLPNGDEVVSAENDLFTTTCSIGAISANVSVAFRGVYLPLDPAPGVGILTVS